MSSELSIKKLSEDSNSILLSITGKDAKPVIINTVRRIIIGEIPTHAYCNIIIDKNTSVYDNDDVRHRISMIPIFNVEHTVDLFDRLKFYQDYPKLAEKYDLALFDSAGNDIKLAVDQKYLNKVNDNINASAYDKKIELRGFMHNKSQNTVDFTTHDCEGDIIKEYKNRPPILINKLKAGQIFSFKATSRLSTVKCGGHQWDVAVIDRYARIKDGFELGITTLGALSCKSIIFKACSLIVKKLEIIKNHVLDNYANEKGNNIKLILHQESHTMGYLINFFLQDHKEVVLSGFTQPHPMIDEIIINFVVSNGKSMNIFADVIEDIKMIFLNFIRQLE